MLQPDVVGDGGGNGQMRAKLKDNRTALQHTGGWDEKGKVTKAKKKISYLFHSVDLKNAQESSMTEELIGFILHYLSFSLSSPLFSLSHAWPCRHFSLPILEPCLHPQTCAFTIKLHLFLSVALSFTLFPLPINPSLSPSAHTHKHTFSSRTQIRNAPTWWLTSCFPKCPFLYIILSLTARCGSCLLKKPTKTNK